MRTWSRRRPRASKHMSYFDLMEALGNEGCPICKLAGRTAFRFLDILSYENVNDPGIRAQLRASRGFCNYHAWQFFDEADDGLGTAIIYGDIVDSLLKVLDGDRTGFRSADIQQLTAALRRPGRAAALAERMAPEGECLACLQLDGSAHRYVDTLLAHLAEEELRERYLASHGLCLPHLRQALPRAETTEEVQLLVEPVAGRLAALASASSPEREAIIQMLVGAEGALPNFATLGRARLADDAGPMVAEAAVPPAEPHGDGCPICIGVQAAVDAYLRRMALAVDEEMAVTTVAAQTRGLCNRHAWGLARLLPAHAADARWPIVAAAASEVLQRSSATQEATAAPSPYRTLRLLGQCPPGPGAALAESLAPRAPCPACQLEAVTERHLVEQLLGNSPFRSPDGQGKQQGGLCLPHFILALRPAASGKERSALVKAQAGIYRLLIADLREYVRKRDYRFAHERPAEEADSPERAVAWVVGARGL
ncbi:MAG: DUF6062 family protein [Chloroflexota bacterium]